MKLQTQSCSANMLQAAVEYLNAEDALSIARAKCDEDKSEENLNALNEAFSKKFQSKQVLQAMLYPEIDLAFFAPRWDEEHQAVFIPLINKLLDSKNLCEDERTWDEAMQLAKAAGKELISKKDAYALLFFKEEINDILREHDGDLLEGYFWSSLESSATYAWFVGFGNGYLTYNNYYVKSGTCQVRAINVI